MPLVDIGVSMTWREALNLTGELQRESTSHVAASMAEWNRPVSEAALVLMALFDGYASVHTRKGAKPARWPHPGEKKPKAIGAGTALTPEQFKAEWKRLTERSDA